MLGKHLRQGFYEKFRIKQIAVSGVTNRDVQPLFAGLPARSVTRSHHGDNWWETEKYQILTCNGCGTPCVRIELSNKDSVLTDPRSGAEIDTTFVGVYPPKDYPSRIFMSQILPAEVRGIYRELLVAMREELPILAATGMRAVIEAACRAYGATGKLDQQIKQLVEKQVIHRNDAELLHALRCIGNDAIHEASSFSRSDLVYAMEVIDGVLDRMFMNDLRHAVLVGIRNAKGRTSGLPPESPGS